MSDKLSVKLFEFGVSIGGQDPRDAQAPYRVAMSAEPSSLLLALGADEEAVRLLEQSSAVIETRGRKFLDPTVMRATQQILQETGFWENRLNLPRDRRLSILKGAVTVEGAVPDLPQVSDANGFRGRRQVRINRVLGDRIAETFKGDESELVYDATTLTLGQVSVARGIGMLSMPWARQTKVVRLRGLTWSTNNSGAKYGRSPMEQAVIDEVYAPLMNDR